MRPFQIAKYDIPAFMELVKEKSNVKNMTIVAVSMASQKMFYNLITNAAYFGQNVNFLVTIGPLAKGTWVSSANVGFIKFFSTMAPVL